MRPYLKNVHPYPTNERVSGDSSMMILSGLANVVGPTGISDLSIHRSHRLGITHRDATKPTRYSYWYESAEKQQSRRVSGGNCGGTRNMRQEQANGNLKAKILHHYSLRLRVYIDGRVAGGGPSFIH